MLIFEKDPDEVRDYGFDWSDRIGEDSIGTSSWSFSPTGELAVDADTHDTTITAVLLKDGNVGTTYLVSNEITTTNQKKLIEQFKVYVREKGN